MDFPIQISVTDLLYTMWVKNPPNKKFCFILGAGASKESGIPTGRDLAEKWYKETFRNIGIDDIQKWLIEIGCSDTTRLAEYYSQIYRKRFEKDELEAFETLQALMENKQPSYGYMVLAQILTRSVHNVVITTNFDSLAEDAMFLSTDRRPIVCGHESLASFIKPVMNRPLIVKVHRDLFLHPKSSVEQLSHLAPAFEWSLARLFQYYTPIVIGYAGNDGSLMGLLSKLPTLSKRIFWCARGDINEKTQQLLKDQNGYLINIDGFDSLMSQISVGFGLDKFNDNSVAIAERKLSAFKQQLNSSGLDSAKKSTIQKAFDDARNTRKPWYKYIRQADTARNINERLVVIEDGLKEFPDSAELHGSRAACLDSLNKNEEARAAYLNAIELNPKSSVIVFNYCNLLRKTRANDDEIERWYTKLIEVDPTMGEGLGGYAQYLEGKGEIDKAEIYYKKSVQHGGNAAWLYGAYGCYLRDRRNNYDLAERYFQQAILKDPTYPNVLYCYADLLYRFRQNYDEAEEYFKKALVAKPDYLKVLEDYAEFLSEVRGDHDQAEKLFKQAIGSNRVAASTLTSYATFLRTVRGDWDGAETFYRKALQVQPDDSFSCASYAVFISENRKNDRLARDYFEKAISMDTDNASVLLQYAKFVNSKLKDFRKAQEYYDRAFKIDGRNSKEMLNYGTLLYQVKEYEKAEQYFTKAFCVHPISSESFRIYAAFLKNHKLEYELANQYYHKAVIADPLDVISIEDYAIALIEQGRLHEAEIQIKFAIAMERPRPNSFCIYASILSGLGYEEQSVQNIRRALEIDSNHAVALENLGVHYFKANDLHTAKKYFERALDVNSQNASAMINYSILLELQGAQKAADEYVAKAYEIDPDNSRVLSSMGGMLMERRKDYVQARVFYRRAIERNPRNTEAYRNIARLELDSRNYQEALKYYQEAVKHNPNHNNLLREYGEFLIRWTDQTEKGRELISKANSTQHPA